MARRVLGFALVACVLGGWSGAATAEPIGDFCNSVARDIKRRNCWPQPFACPDRANTRAPFVGMVANGWRRQNMLTDYHFDELTGQLNEAGKLKLRWIMVEAPAQHRIVYVHVATTPAETSARIAGVAQIATELFPEQGAPPVLATTISNEGWPADRVDWIGRKFQATMPPPQLPPDNSGSGQPAP